MTGVLVNRFGEKANFNKTLLPLLLGLTLGALAAAYWARHHWVISRADATPTWLFICCAIFFALFVLIYWITDVAGKGKWFKFLFPAGVASLSCYMISFVWYNVQALSGWDYPKMLNDGLLGLLRSLIFSLVCIGIVWLLMKIKVRLKI
jgi:heparan-alpha-glucosaminide N-acetyltransferase